MLFYLRNDFVDTNLVSCSHRLVVCKCIIEERTTIGDGIDFAFLNQLLVSVLIIFSCCIYMFGIKLANRSSTSAYYVTKCYLHRRLMVNL